MTKETKNTVSAETIVENLKEFVEALHDVSKKAMLYYLLTEDIDMFKTAKTMHSVSHDLLDILDGKSVEELWVKLMKMRRIALWLEQSLSM